VQPDLETALFKHVCFLACRLGR